MIQTETQIFIALIKAVVEQSTTLTNEYKQKLKQDFNIWQKQGFKIIEELEKQNKLNEDYVNNITDIYHNINLEIRTSTDTKRI
jgi:DNA-directed RNA polymerase subunit F